MVLKDSSAQACILIAVITFLVPLLKVNLLLVVGVDMRVVV